MKIELGTSAAGPATLDLDLLLRTRLLVQASSGGGKSWLLRRLAEQLFGKVPVWIIDPEGEFATLRERYGYVLVGKGGETPADRRSAALVAHKLLELRASAVCDLYEVKPADRHEWVKLFLEALVDAPKKLWQPLVVIVDESHQFAPEKGAGESQASDAMIGLATRGRKRGFCAVFATQRLGKLRKDAAAELLNVLIGQTFIDIDRARAADALGMPTKGAAALAFFNEMRLLKPGRFYGLGRAISTERLLMTVGPVSTSHPEAGSARQAAESPPTPAKVKEFLPKLADLPAVAEARAQTEAELRTEIRSLKAQLAARPTVTVPETKIERVEVPVLALDVAERLRQHAGAIQAAGEGLAKTASEVTAALQRAQAAGEAAARRQVAPPPANRGAQPRQATQVHDTRSRQASALAGGDGHFSGPEQKILDELAALAALGITAPVKIQLALMSGYSNPRSGGFSEPLRRLCESGMVHYPRPGFVAITESGLVAARPAAVPASTEELQSRLLEKLDGPRRRILEALIQIYPVATTKDDLGGSLGYTNVRSGGFSEPLRSLRELGLIDYPSPGRVVALPVLFLEERT